MSIDSQVASEPVDPEQLGPDSGEKSNPPEITRRSFIKKFLALCSLVLIGSEEALRSEHRRKLAMIQEICTRSINGDLPPDLPAEFAWFPELEAEFYSWVNKHRHADAPVMNDEELLRWIALWLGIHVQYEKVDNVEDLVQVAQGDFAMRRTGVSRAFPNFPPDLPVKNRGVPDEEAPRIISRCGGETAFTALLLSRMPKLKKERQFGPSCTPDTIEMWLTRSVPKNLKSVSSMLHYCVSIGFASGRHCILGRNDLGFASFHDTDKAALKRRLLMVNNAQSATHIFSVQRREEISAGESLELAASF